MILKYYEKRTRIIYVKKIDENKPETLFNLYNILI